MHGRFLLKLNQEKSTTTALKNTIEKEKRKPRKIWSDRGKEFYNKTFLDFLEQNEKQHYSNNLDLKAVLVERLNRTLSDLIKKPMYIEGKFCWLSHLDAALQKYNNRVHGTTKMTPFEASNNIEGALGTAQLASHTEGASRKLVLNLKFSNIKNEVPKFQVGDYVRVPDNRNYYSKGYTTYWNGELLKYIK